ncbi:hypothetical protein JXM67_06410 [candidate division WOR-3 bacterium]|nr:hypothetical protein [candidate division WOR-3 bacterium]
MQSGLFWVRIKPLVTVHGYNQRSGIWGKDSLINEMRSWLSGPVDDGRQFVLFPGNSWDEGARRLMPGTDPKGVVVRLSNEAFKF